MPAHSSAVHTKLPDAIRLQIVTSSTRPPAGDAWLHEIKHDCHRIAKILDECM
jgi:hypothetical protein